MKAVWSVLTGFTAAVLYNGLGRYEEAFAAARDGCEYEDLGFHGWCLFELIEAAARTRRAGSRRRWPCGGFEERAGASGTDWGLGALASARALLADDEHRRRPLHRSHRTPGAHPHRRCTSLAPACVTANGCVG